MPSTVIFIGLVSSIDKQKQDALNPQVNSEPNMSKESPEKVSGLERRDFIKLSAAGVAVSLTGCATSESKPQTPPDTGDTAATATTPPQAKKPSIPEVGNLIDPAFVNMETWQEPWTWRPELWPGANLELNLVENQNPGNSPSPGNPTSALFSYNGTSPGPTVRVRSDGNLHVKVRNTLGLNKNQTPVGPSPDRFEFVPEVRNKICSLIHEQVRGGDPENPVNCRPIMPFFYPEQALQVVHTDTRPGWDLGGHVNGQHAAHTTNLHTHGLHVFPQSNPDGTHSDNVLLRIIPKADLEARIAAGKDPSSALAHHEHVGELDYKIQLAFERDGQSMPHPPGTHWYHPHSHGATHDQVASGMAGFLIVEGDVDEAINLAMTGEKRPQPEEKTGSFDYRERLIMVQRVEVPSSDLDAGVKKRNLRFPPLLAVNGVRGPTLIKMRPGAIERWRVLNGSVDGAGTKRFMVLEGQFVQRENKIWRVIAEGDQDNRKRRLEPVSEQDFEDAKLDIHQLSLDGITLVSVEGGKARHRIKDLSRQNAGTSNPFASADRPGETKFQGRLRAFESVFKDGDSLRRSFVRPNEVYMTNANRADLFFKAPLDAAGRVFTIFAKEAHIHTDNYQQMHQRWVDNPKMNPFRPLFDVVVGYIHVDGKAVEGGDFDIQGLNQHLPPVPPLLQPITASELEVPAGEAAKTGVAPGSKRCRTISYSGTGGPDFPTIRLPEGFAEQHPELENVFWATHEGTQVLMPNLTRTMGINTEFDLTVNPEPGLAHKFAHNDPKRSRVLVDTAEEWVLYNSSTMLWCHTDRERFPQPGSYNFHYESFPMSRAEGQRRFAEDPEFRISVKGADHPFHIHVNPMWVLRVDVPDENGELHNILPEPAWMDTVPIPRNGGRVVFRTRFDDFVGQWVNHCHILLHEDMGMMQIVECTDDPADTNYQSRQKAASHAMPASEVDAIYPKPSRETMYKQSLAFIDPSEVGYQVYPGFELKVPKPD
jgi:FtsP/CotA-like multicopper oxidase with cupredoxin domain